MKTCKKMGIKTVAVHSDVDSNAVSHLHINEGYIPRMEIGVFSRR